MRRILLPLALAGFLAGPALAVQPDEILDDPALEARAREISRDLRCLVCRNENIDDSDAGLARDLRLLVRERLLEGDSNREVVDFIVDRYGEYVLLNPRREGMNLLLWLAGPAMLILGGGVSLVYIRRRRTDATLPDTPLSPEEQKRLDQILDR
ncbi:cytochrome c-type biogenesis protein [Szabonella alba]|uniref:Cytochrome c-type biogenesis protein n=1 Tax=Szabonella alba TaxID=2804194 RepID=A0A8K0Y051_9RHOB|nr:cytochrome c-type biogenesis protein [Szabonella alba]MBL4917491.1 cytochrome c-type biogenesis protein CcmH [Szabonella alba]